MSSGEIPVSRETLDFTDPSSLRSLASIASILPPLVIVLVSSAQADTEVYFYSFVGHAVIRSLPSDPAVPTGRQRSLEILPSRPPTVAGTDLATKP
jgi:hypothetical protein